MNPASPVTGPYSGFLPSDRLVQTQCKAGRCNRMGGTVGWACLLASVVWGAGCGQMGGFLTQSGGAETRYVEEQRQREEYLASHSADSLRWLVTHRLKNGMSKKDVDSVIGEEGEREFRDQEILGEGGLYRSDDLVYRWGPDREGNVYMFVFRDDHLINFENFREELKSLDGAPIGISVSSDDL